MAFQVNKKTVCEQLVEHYRKQIESGVFKPGDVFPSERTLEIQLGISRKTVGKAVSILAGQGYLFKEQGRTTYVADYRNTVKVVPSVRNIGICFQSPESVYHPANGSVFMELCNQLRKSSFGVELLFDRSSDLGQVGSVLAERNICGLFLFPPAIEGAFMQSLHLSVPVVMLAGDNSDESSFAADVTQAVEIAVERLAASGHQRIAFLYGNENWKSDMERIAQFRKTLEQQGLAYDNSRVLSCHYERLKTIAAVDQLLHNVPDAIVCADDMVARWTIDELAAHGLRVPDDVAVIGFNDMEMYSMRGEVALTTFAIPARDIVSAAVDCMFRHIENPFLPSEHAYFPMKLIARSSG